MVPEMPHIQFAFEFRLECNKPNGISVDVGKRKISTMGGLGDWTNFVFYGKFLKKLGRFLFYVIFYFFWAKKPEN